MLEGIAFDERGLVPCVVQDQGSGEVLTLAYMNEEALKLTLDSGEMHFFSRSRGELWHKGATSGNVQRLCQLRYDCDGDALVALVEPDGPACHTGERSCFYREVGGSASTEVDAPAADGEPEPAAHEALAVLERTLRLRAAEQPDGSYTAELLADAERLAGKVAEESEEVTRAAREESDERVAEEAADLVYHLSVLLRSRDVDVAEVLEVLNGRRR